MEPQDPSALPPRPVIPPPNLAPPPPPPPSPLEALPRSAGPPPLIPAGNDAARVKLRHGNDGEVSLGDGIAPFNTRCIAAIIDIVVAAGITIGLDLILPDFAGKIAWLAGAAYLVTRDSLPFLGGQSIGKKAMKIQAVTLEGTSLVGNWNSAIARNLVLIIPLFALVELFVLLTREDKPERGRRLGDEWAKTKVIFEVKPTLPDAAG